MAVPRERFHQIENPSNSSDPSNRTDMPSCTVGLFRANKRRRRTYYYFYYWFSSFSFSISRQHAFDPWFRDTSEMRETLPFLFFLLFFLSLPMRVLATYCRFINPSRIVVVFVGLSQDDPQQQDLARAESAAPIII
ncbi:hypothetical protein F4775DRAFT_401014 [Biscogniauxia sp. FL1348]|nr:hypothetical protein F4775DRAFT_401014 [Biscogniauxia sp. FL1348]